MAGEKVRDEGSVLTNPYSARDFKAMMRHVGADPERAAVLAPEAVRHAENACACCRTVARCHEWLARGRTGDEPGSFCPNVPTFEALAHLVPAKGE